MTLNYLITNFLDLFLFIFKSVYSNTLLQCFLLFFVVIILVLLGSTSGLGLLS